MLHAENRIMGILPFHSLALRARFACRATGVGVVFIQPSGSRVIGALVNKYAVTMLLATPTFLNA